LAEWPDRTPKTMGFSASTFLEFILMASRRVQADRFYTEDFRPEIYTPEGIARIRNLNGMRDVIERNAPNLKEAVSTRESSFHPLGKDPIPLNNSGIDMLPTNDMQSQFAAFDSDRNGELTFGEIANGYKAMGYNSAHAYLKAASVRHQFGKVIADVKPTAGIYKADGSIDQTRIDSLFKGRDAISISEAEKFAGSSSNGAVSQEFALSQLGVLRSAGSKSVTRDSFVKAMRGDILRQKIAEQKSK